MSDSIRTPLTEFLRKFRRQRLALAAGFFVALLVLIAIFAPWIVPYDAEGYFDYDALNASMILGGMGPVDKITSNSGKLFASFYALYSGIVFIGIAGIIVAPVAHRVLHKLHLADKDR